MDMDNSRLRELTERFASLQAAHRALARSVHPSELEPLRRQSRLLLVQLQGLSSRLKGEAPVSGSESVTVEEVSNGLDKQTERTLEVLAGLEISQLRATVPMLSRDHPDEVKGLVDSLLAGSLEDDKQLRTLEYLITELSADERAGRRVLVQEPSRVTARLYALSTVRFAGDPEADEAVRYLEEAAARVFKETEIGEIRDSAREYKKELKTRILNARVLAATVAYNVAMWNRVAAEIDSSRSIGELAEGLFVPTQAGQGPGQSTRAQQHLLGTPAFEQLVKVVAAMVNEQPLEDSTARSLSRHLSLESLRPDDVEVFSGDDATESVWLMRAAITLGLVMQGRPEVDAPLVALGLDPDLLARDCIEDLMTRMTARARKLMAENRHADAFRLSDVKTHSLTTHVSAMATPGSLASGGSPTVVASAASVDSSADSAASAGRPEKSLTVAHWLVAAALMVGLYLLVIGPPGGEPTPQQTPARTAESRVQAINPFLEWGRHAKGETPRRFVARVGRAWDWLGTPERSEVVIQIGEYFQALGTTRVVLTDQAGQVVARYADGEIVEVAPR